MIVFTAMDVLVGCSSSSPSLSLAADVGTAAHVGTAASAAADTTTDAGAAAGAAASASPSREPLPETAAAQQEEVTNTAHLGSPL